MEKSDNISISFLLALILFLIVPKIAHSRDAEVGGAVPEMVMGEYNPEDWRGKPHIVNFFASWCVPCKGEHPYLMEMFGQGLKIVGVAYKDRSYKAQGYLEKEGSPYALLAFDQKGKGGAVWGTTGVPETFVIDSGGLIRFHQVGPLTEELVKNEIMPLWKSIEH